VSRREARFTTKVAEKLAEPYRTWLLLSVATGVPRAAFEGLPLEAVGADGYLALPDGSRARLSREALDVLVPYLRGWRAAHASLHLFPKPSAPDEPASAVMVKRALTARGQKLLQEAE